MSTLVGTNTKHEEAAGDRQGRSIDRIIFASEQFLMQDTHLILAFGKVVIFDEDKIQMKLEGNSEKS